MKPITEQFLNALYARFNFEQIRINPLELELYSCDGLQLHNATPGCVILPETAEDISWIVKKCNEFKVPFVPRGAGTGLSGGAVIEDGLIIQLSRLNKIIEIDIPNKCAIVQPGVVNAHLSQEVNSCGFHFAPDPSSQIVSTIGGNVAENAGGPHTLKYGVTVNHVLGQKVILPSGEIIQIGDKSRFNIGIDLNSLFTGSEGTLGIVSEIIVNLNENPKAIRTFLLTFNQIEKATDLVTEILLSGVIPSALELIDKLCIQAVEDHLKIGFPKGAEAILIIELDGDFEEVGFEAEKIRKVSQLFISEPIVEAKNEIERQRLWKGRKHAAAAIGNISPAFYTNDGVVPRDKLTEILKYIHDISKKFDMKIANLCHAGDGNIHPLILYNPKSKTDVIKAFECSTEILKKCIDLGGVLTGEHGIGIEKIHLMKKMFGKNEIELQRRIKEEIDPFNLLNPGKLIPNKTGCGELNLFRGK
jgi:glycolate oxidase